jgi:hypothetical protein
MADILNSLLSAYAADIATLQASTFSYINSVFVMEQPALLPPNYSAPLPTVLIYPGLTTLTPRSVGPFRSDEKHYIVMISIFKEFVDDAFTGDTYEPGIITIASAFEDRYNRNTLNLSLACLLKSINFNMVGITPFMGCVQAHLQFDHLYFDSRTS